MEQTAAVGAQMVEDILLKSVVTFLLVALVLPAIEVRADRSSFWRYAGGKPEFVGGGVCALPRTEPVEFLQRKGYDVLFAPRLQMCLCVAYSLTPSDVSNKVGRIGGFKRDDDLGEKATDPKLYAGTGYDRGHMAPSQDMQYDIEVSRQSFWMGNITPQTPRLNRGDWKRLEGIIHRKVMPSPKGDVSARRVYVLTGPIFTKEVLQQFEKDIQAFDANGGQGNRPLIKPRSFWKIFKYGATVEAVIMDQTVPGDYSADEWGARSVSVGEIAKVTGLSFFSGMAADLRDFYLGYCRPMYGGDRKKKEKTTEKEE